MTAPLRAGGQRVFRVLSREEDTGQAHHWPGGREWFQENPASPEGLSPHAVTKGLTGSHP
jgi:hypothetical protein